MRPSSRYFQIFREAAGSRIIISAFGLSLIALPACNVSSESNAKLAIYDKATNDCTSGRVVQYQVLAGETASYHGRVSCDQKLDLWTCNLDQKLRAGSEAMQIVFGATESCETMTLVPRVYYNTGPVPGPDASIETAVNSAELVNPIWQLADQNSGLAVPIEDAEIHLTLQGSGSSIVPAITTIARISAGRLQCIASGNGCEEDGSFGLPKYSVWTYEIQMTSYLGGTHGNIPGDSIRIGGTLDLRNAKNSVLPACPASYEVARADQDADTYYDLAAPIGNCVPVSTPREDCDDNNALIHPGGDETCNTLDDNCDGVLDNIPGDTDIYVDVDQDSFGAVQAMDCSVSVANRAGDCDDENNTVFPDAPEICDHLDNDCDQDTDETFIQSFYLLDRDGDGFGDPASAVCSEADLSMAVSARGDCNDADASVHPFGIDVAGDGLDSDCGGEDEPDPFVAAPDDSGTQLQAAIDAANDGVATPATTVWVGPGTYFERNISLSGKTVALRSTGGPDATILDAGFDFPTTTLIYIANTESEYHALLDGFTLTGAEASLNTDETGGTSESGGALYISGSSATLANLIIRNNMAANCGGAFILNSSVSLHHNLIVDNDAVSTGGFCLIDSNVDVKYSTFANNSASYGAGGLSIIYSNDTDAQWLATLSTSLFAYNVGLDLAITDPTGQQVTVRSSALFNIGISHNLETLDSTVQEVDPAFVSIENIAELLPDYHLMNASPLRDQLETELDPDGSLASLGTYGGPGADLSYDRDQDRDGMPDGWEIIHGLQPGSNDATSDADRDGATNLEEYQQHLDPQNSDCDTDSNLDGPEIDAGSDPLEWNSQPGQVETPVILMVPEDFETIQDAVNRINREGTIEVSSATPESIRIEARTVKIVGTATDARVTVQAVEGLPVMSILSANVRLENLTVSGGTFVTGGGIFSESSRLELDHVEVSGNAAQETDEIAADGRGGGLAAFNSSVTASNSYFIGNQVCGNGAGLYLLDSDVVLQQSVVADNLAQCNVLGGGAGGGLFASNTLPTTIERVTLNNVMFSGNEAADGTAMVVSNVAANLTNAILVGNILDVQNSNGIVRSEFAKLTMTNCIFTQNSGIPVSSADTRDNPDYVPILTYNCFPVSSWCDALSDTDSTNQCMDPQFLYYDSEGVPVDFHLALPVEDGVENTLIDGGDPDLRDVDGSLSDLGLYGGSEGGSWDLDDDGFANWFWPGTISDSPAGFFARFYDSDDTDATLH